MAGKLEHGAWSRLGFLEGSSVCRVLFFSWAYLPLSVGVFMYPYNLGAGFGVNFSILIIRNPQNSIGVFEGLYIVFLGVPCFLKLPRSRLDLLMRMWSCK